MILSILKDDYYFTKKINTMSPAYAVVRQSMLMDKIKTRLKETFSEKDLPIAYEILNKKILSESAGRISMSIFVFSGFVFGIILTFLVAFGFRETILKFGNPMILGTLFMATMGSVAYIISKPMAVRAKKDLENLKSTRSDIYEKAIDIRDNTVV